MRRLGHGIAVGVLVLFVGRSPGWTPEQIPAFDLVGCGTNATDIVVTDADGRVLECWRGELKPGELVRLGPARLSLVNTLPWEHLRLRPDRALSELYRGPESFCTRRVYGHYYDGAKSDVVAVRALWPDAADGAETGLRFVLFLRREGISGPGAIWLPATAPPLAVGYRFGPAFYHPNIDSSTSVVTVEGGRLVALCGPLSSIYGIRINFNCGEPRETALSARTLNDLKDEVKQLPAPLSRPVAPKPPEPSGSLQRLMDSGTFTQYPPFHLPGTHP